MPPNVTDDAPARSVPCRVTSVPPSVVPVFGVTDETVGAATKVKPFSSADDPPGPVTVTFTAPAGCAGVRTVRVPSPLSTRETPSTEPKVTLVAPARPAPVSVTTVPPEVGPAAGLTVNDPGAAMNVKGCDDPATPSALRTDTAAAPGV